MPAVRRRLASGVTKKGARQERNTVPLERLLAIAILVLLLVEIAAEGLRWDTLSIPWNAGSDPSTYFGAGQRLNDGHALYGPLLPTDWPIGLQPPILSPPPIAILWRPLALLPPTVAMFAWWIAGLLVLTGLCAWMIYSGGRLLRRLILALLVLWPLISVVFGVTSLWLGFFPGIPSAATSGNVNSFIVALVVLTWFAAARGRQGIAGVAAGLATALKVFPGFLVLWFLFTGQYRAVRSFGITLAAVFVASVVGAGLDNVGAYAKVAASTATGDATPLSLQGALRTAGLPTQLSLIIFGATIFGILALAWKYRHKRAWSFAAIVALVIFASPVVLSGNLALLLAAVAPAASDGGVL